MQYGRSGTSCFNIGTHLMRKDDKCFVCLLLERPVTSHQSSSRTIHFVRRTRTLQEHQFAVPPRPRDVSRDGGKVPRDGRVVLLLLVELLHLLELHSVVLTWFGCDGSSCSSDTKMRNREIVRTGVGTNDLYIYHRRHGPSFV